MLQLELGILKSTCWDYIGKLGSVVLEEGSTLGMKGAGLGSSHSCSLMEELR